MAPLPLIGSEELAFLNTRSNGPGWRQLAVHGSVVATGAWLWGSPGLIWPLRSLGLVLLGVGLAFAFCAMHECGHRTAFADRQLNDAVAWWAGVLSFYNADFYRRYHQWHHRYTHLPGLDPELEEAPPTTLGGYLSELSGLPWWLGKLRGHWRGLWGDFEGSPYISKEAAPSVVRSIRLQFAVYFAVALASLPAWNGFGLWFWLVPLAVGQPLLRFVLMAEHQGCPFEANGLRNTRTTLTLAPLRTLMWNMPYHAEHHLYPSLPFHALARAHERLAPHLVNLAGGYLVVHRGFLVDLGALRMPAATTP